jgi:CRP-like cAMP-binding protein
MTDRDAALVALAASMRELCDAPPQMASSLLGICAPARIEKGGHFVRAGERSRAVGFNLNGIFRYYYLSEGGTDFTKAFSAPGKFLISYSAIAQDRESYFSIEALTDAEILRFDYDDWMGLARRDPGWDRFFFKLVESVYIMKELREKEFLLDDAATRYEAFRRDYPGLEGVVKQYHVASFLGITPEALSRIRKELKLT